MLAEEKKKVMIIEDDSTSAKLIEIFLENAGYHTRCVGSIEETKKEISGSYHGAVIGHHLHDGNGVELVRWFNRMNPRFPCIIISASADAADAVSSIKSGALNYFVKPVSWRDLILELDTSIRSGNQLDTLATPEWRSLAMKHVDRQVRQVATTSVPVLISGHCRSCSRRVATWVHASSSRSKKRFELIDLRKPEQNAALENLFGGRAYNRPAKPGLLERASDTSIIFDSIDLLPPDGQGKLLDHFNRISRDFHLKPSPRLIFMTNRSLAEMAAADFDSELLHLISPVQIQVPALDQASEDIETWGRILIAELAYKMGRNYPVVTPSAWSLLEERSWPGNLVQLRQILEGALATAQSDTIGVADMMELLSDYQASYAIDRFRPGSTKIAELEKLSLIYALRACEGNRRCAAERLGVSLRTIYNMLKRHKISHDHSLNIP